MHCRWLRCSILFIVTIQILAPGFQCLKLLDAKKWNDAANDKTPLMILLYSDDCEECEQAEVLLDNLMQQEELNVLMPGVQIFKEKLGTLLSRSLKIESSPSLILIRDDSVVFYSDKMDQLDSIIFWLEKAGASTLTKVLTDDTFEHLTQASTGSTTGHWLVYFYKPACDEYLPILESVGVKSTYITPVLIFINSDAAVLITFGYQLPPLVCHSEKMWLNIAKVDVESNPILEHRFKVSFCPEIIYFREGKMYRYEPQKYEVPSLTSFVKSWYTNVKASRVPVEPTSFDVLTENIAAYIKSQLEGENKGVILVASAGLMLTIIITVVFCCITGGSDSKLKKE